MKQALIDNLQAVLADVTSRLEQASTPYMVSGAIAGNYYGLPRSTTDIDIVVRLAPGDAGCIAESFRPDYVVSEEAKPDALSVSSQFSLIHLHRIVKFDLILKRADDFGDQEFSRRRRADIGGVPAWITSPEDLVLSKLLWSRDSASEVKSYDIQGLLRIQNDLDNEYLDRWTRSLGVTRPIAEGSPTRDTSPEFFKNYCQMLAVVTPEERSRMGFACSEFVRTLLIQSVARLPESERAGELLRRLYGTGRAVKRPTRQ
jgi:hypothetical protein